MIFDLEETETILIDCSKFYGECVCWVRVKIHTCSKGSEVGCQGKFPHSKN